MNFERISSFMCVFIYILKFNTKAHQVLNRNQDIRDMMTPK